MSRLSETEACGFEDLFEDIQTRAGLVVTFLALLEMIRLKLIRVFQTGVVGPIRDLQARPARRRAAPAARSGASARRAPGRARRRKRKDQTPDLKVGPTGKPCLIT